MNTDELRTRQAPLKARYREEPQTAFQTLRAEAVLNVEGLSCAVPTPGPLAVATARSPARETCCCRPWRGVPV